MRQNDLLDWYETNLPAKERKLRGHFSTPPHLVTQILNACSYVPERDLAQIRVLDPACGSGNFVAGAEQRLIAYGKRAKLSSSAIATLVGRNIWGFDPDPVACFLAEMQMRNVFLERDIPETERNSDVRPGELKRDASRGMSIEKVQIHQADGLAFPWHQGGQVDLLLANPPYLAAKNNDLSVYRSAQQRGQADSYLLFLELALQVVRPGGWIGLVLPDPVLARSNAAQERRRLLAETTVHHLWHLADVFAAYVGAVVIVAQKQPPTAVHHVAWKREHWQQRKTLEVEDTAESAIGEHYGHEIYAGGSGSISQKLLHLQEGAELRYLLSRLQGTLVERIYMQLQIEQVVQTAGSTHGLIWLKDLVQIRRGEEISKESPLLSRRLARNEKAENWYPVLRGGSDVRPYGIPGTQYWIAREKIVKPLERYLGPKLLVVKSAGRLQASLDMHGHIVLQTLYTLSINEDTMRSLHSCTEMPDDSRESLSQQNYNCLFTVEDELYYLLALLNSRLLQEYVYVLHTAYKWVQPQIEQRVLAQLPIPQKVDAQEKGQIIQRSKQIMHTCSQSSSDVELKEQRQAWYEEQERAISRLYQAAIQEGQQEKPIQGFEQEPPLNVLDEGVIEYG